MCGICGKINVDGKPVERDLIERMNSCLSHRGPDGDGVYIENFGEKRQSTTSVGLGHRRLSIIDLSSAGAQPMPNEDKTVWMVFNGEIYNHEPLRKTLQSKGHRFISKTDCEVIIHLYEEEGINSLKKLNGMFAFCLWDSRKQTAYLCRDRLGIKPLLYYWNGQSLIFASEMRSILADASVTKTIDVNALNLYLTFNYIPAPYTIFEKIKKIPPGAYLSLQNKNIKVEQYWSLRGDSAKEKCDLETYKQRLRETLEDAVKLQLVADVPVGAFLSGGIDSSIVVGLMAKSSSSAVKTYSIGFADMPLFDETRYAKEVAQMHKTEHQEIILNSKDIIPVFTDILSWFDEPFADSSAIPTFIVSRETRKHVKVALSGDGGDELFAGYRMYTGEYWFQKYQRIPGIIRQGLIEPVLSSLSDSRDNKLGEYARRMKKFTTGAKGNLEGRFFAWNEIVSRPLRESLLKKKNINFDVGRALFKEYLNAFSGDDINRMLYTDLSLSLPGDMLAKVDGMSMKNSLEVRVPLLDHRVVELAFKMPGNLKLRGGKGKYIFLETFKDILPASLLKRSKRGFEIPLSRWLKTDLKFLLDEHLCKEKIERGGIFNYAPIEELKKNLLSNRTDTSWQLWNLIVFQAWMERAREKL